MKPTQRSAILFFSLLFSISTAQAELPDPLNLKHLLQNHQTYINPSIALATANLSATQAKTHIANTTNPLTLDAEGRIGWREFAEETSENHRAVLHLNKTLYDFNRSASLQSAAEYQEQAAQIDHLTAVENHKINLMAGFFNIILADYQFRVDNEAMAIEFVGFDKFKDRLALKRISDVDYLQAEVTYQKALTKRSISEQKQRQTRVELANILGNAELMAGEIILPKLINPKLKTIEDYQALAHANNPHLKALQTQHEAALQQVALAEANDNATLSFDAYAGQLDSFPEKREGTWRVDLNVNVPLYDGGQTQGKVQLAQANAAKIAAQIAQQKLALNQQVIDLYFAIKAAQTESIENQVFGDYADLYLDFSRGMYENELKTDLGDAMVRLSLANLKTLTTQFQRTLAWAKLNQLIGNSITYSLISQVQPKTTIDPQKETK